MPSLSLPHLLYRLSFYICISAYTTVKSNIYQLRRKLKCYHVDSREALQCSSCSRLFVCYQHLGHSRPQRYKCYYHRIHCYRYQLLPPPLQLVKFHQRENLRKFKNQLLLIFFCIDALLLSINQYKIKTFDSKYTSPK